ncbi:12190_t:CDS:1, partial [Dentiscutata heterogama]
DLANMSFELDNSYNNPNTFNLNPSSQILNKLEPILYDYQESSNNLLKNLVYFDNI